MKRILVLFLALILVACGAPAPTGQPTSAPPQPTQTAAILVQTVVVTVIPSQVPTQAPSVTPLPPPTEAAAPTQAVATQPPVATAAEANTTGGPISLDDALGAGFFTNLNRSRNDFSLRCAQNKEITFSAKPTDANISQVEFYYRIEDRGTGAVLNWQNGGRMIADASGIFTIVFSGDDVNPNFRKPNAWFDYQFIGGNATGVVGRSEKIEKQVTYTFDCP